MLGIHHSSNGKQSAIRKSCCARDTHHFMCRKQLYYLVFLATKTHQHFLLRCYRPTVSATCTTSHNLIVKNQGKHNLMLDLTGRKNTPYEANAAWRLGHDPPWPNAVTAHVLLYLKNKRPNNFFCFHIILGLSRNPHV